MAKPPGRVGIVLSERASPRPLLPARMAADPALRDALATPTF